MHAKLTEDEITVIEDLAAEARDMVHTQISEARQHQLLNLLGRIRNICYLKRAEIRMQKRIGHNCEVGMPGANYDTPLSE